MFTTNTSPNLLISALCIPSDTKPTSTAPLIQSLQHESQSPFHCHGGSPSFALRSPPVLLSISWFSNAPKSGAPYNLGILSAPRYYKIPHSPFLGKQSTDPRWQFMAFCRGKFAFPYKWRGLKSEENWRLGFGGGWQLIFWQRLRCLWTGRRIYLKWLLRFLVLLGSVLPVGQSLYHQRSLI